MQRAAETLQHLDLPSPLQWAVKEVGVKGVSVKRGMQEQMEQQRKGMMAAAAGEVSKGKADDDETSGPTSPLASAREAAREASLAAERARAKLAARSPKSVWSLALTCPKRD